MGTRDAYAAGTFCWVDLLTVDAPAARAFYAELLGWDEPEEPGYGHWTSGGRDVAGVYAIEGAVPAWTSYVAVDDAAAVAARAGALGGRVAEPPADVGEGCRAVLIDPVGARVALWQAGTHPGARLVNDVGCWCSNQLQAPDPSGAVAFYAELFGWDVEATPGSEPPYWEVRSGGRDNGGIVASDGPPAWVAYFHVADADATAAATAGAGGAVLFPPTTIGLGRIAVLADPQGAVFGVFAGTTDP